MFVRRSVGISIDGENLRLALLSRQLGKVRVLDLLTVTGLQDTPAPELRKSVTAFLKKGKALGAPAVLILPRQQVIFRQLELPKEAEANLPKVVEYQLANLVPLDDTAVCFDYTVSKSSAEAKSFSVTVLMVMKTILESALKTCEGLGLQICRIVPSSVALSNYYLMLSAHFKAPTAMIGYVLDGKLEASGVANRAFDMTREATMAEGEPFSEIESREMEVFRTQMGIAEGVPLQVYLIGTASPAAGEINQAHFKVSRLNRAQELGLQVTKAGFEGRRLHEHFLAVLAACSGLQRRPPLVVNLLPLEKRISKSKWLLVPTFGLLAINLLLVLGLLLRNSIQQRMYSKQLNQEISRLEPEVKKIRNVEKQITDFDRRTELLRLYKKSSSQVLDALNELAKILPKTTFVYDLTFRSGILEMQGLGDGVAALPMILDNSPHFKGAEFVGAITKDVSGQEVFRIRVKLGAAPLPDVQKVGVQRK